VVTEAGHRFREGGGGCTIFRVVKYANTRLQIEANLGIGLPSGAVANTFHMGCFRQTTAIAADCTGGSSESDAGSDRAAIATDGMASERLQRASSQGNTLVAGRDPHRRVSPNVVLGCHAVQRVMNPVAGGAVGFPNPEKRLAI
jgi:hypothetical protein